MKGFFSKIWFPIAVVAAAAANTFGTAPRVRHSDILTGAPLPVVTQVNDTVKYPRNGWKLRWTKEDFLMDVVTIEDTLSGKDSLFTAPEDTLPHLTARDTIKAPDSLRFTDPFRFKYYVALIDSFTHKFVVDSLRQAGDSLDWPRIDSLYYADSAIFAKAKFDAWYASLSKSERKAYDAQQLAKVRQHMLDSMKVIKDSIKHVRDSILENTPRILETFALPDSLQYKRLVQWTHDRDFHDITISPVDTGFNYRFHDYPFLRRDVNATWLGTAGSPVQYYNYFLRESKEDVMFFEPLESWSYSAATLPMYNSKTPYTELSYWGTLLAGTEKESDNLHLLTTQNVTPEFNFTLCYDRFGSGGVLKNERMINKNSYINLNYLGKKYMAHAGFIHDKVSRQENGGVRDNMWIRDTTVEAREIEVALSDASSLVKKNTFFIDQQVRIPFDFIYDMLDTLAERKAVREDEKEYRQRYTEGGMEVTEAGLSAYLHSRKLHRQEAAAEADEGVEYFVPTAFIGHSSELSTYSRYYTDKVSKSDKFADNFYHGVYNYNPSQSSDSLRMMRLDNKLFVRLQPWGEESIVSKLDVGVGDRMQRYYMMDPYYLSTGTSNTWNSFYVYAGARGQYRNYLHWDAKGDYVLLGSEFSDLNIRANAGFNIYPFRRARKSPVSFDLHFQTKLEEPDWYHQHMLTNHFRWDNDFGKISTTKLQGEVSVPRWDLHASAGYALLANTVYFDTLGIARQNPGAISVLTATLEKNFTVGDFLHFDNRLLFQLSSNNDVLPLPSLAVNGRYYAQLKISGGVMLMQLGVDGYWNTAWYAPAWNPAIGVFHNQNEYKYNNGPYFDAFMNIQWKRACIFVKLENAGMGWPMEHKDYFSAHHYINTTRTVKVGIYWPFYTQPAKDTGAAAKLAGGPRGGHSHSH